MSTPNILLIDADQSFALQMSERCQALGWKLQVCTEGRQAVEKALNTNPDGVVLNVEIPYVSGYSICNKIRRNDKLKNVPLALLSRSADERTFAQHKKLRTRADEYFSGEYDASVILSKLRTHFTSQPPVRRTESTQPVTPSTKVSETSSSPSATDSFTETPATRSFSGVKKKGSMILIILVLAIVILLLFYIYVFVVR